MSTPTEAFSTACFSVQAHSDPALMHRVLEPFSKRGLVPAQFHAGRAGPAGEELHVDFQVDGMDPATVQRVAAFLRQIPGVEVVLTAEKRAAISA